MEYFTPLIGSEPLHLNSDPMTVLNRDVSPAPTTLDRRPSKPSACGDRGASLHVRQLFAICETCGWVAATLKSPDEWVGCAPPGNQASEPHHGGRWRSIAGARTQLPAPMLPTRNPDVIDVHVLRYLVTVIRCL